MIKGWRRLPPWLDQAFLAKVIRFAIVGLLGTIVYALIAFAMTRSGLPIITAHTVALIVSLIVSYTGQKIFTFGIRGENRRLGPRFFLATGAIVIVQYVLVISLSYAQLSSDLIVLISTLYYPPTSFLVHNFWTFKK